MERFLNDCDDDELELVKKDEVIEEIALVSIVDPKANHGNVEVFFKTNNDLQNDAQIVEKRGKKIFEPRDEMR